MKVAETYICLVGEVAGEIYYVNVHLPDLVRVTPFVREAFDFSSVKFAEEFLARPKMQHEYFKQFSFKVKEMTITYEIKD